MQDEYDIKKIMEEIEMQLIASMKRTLWSHEEDEKAKGFDWPQWQALKIKQFEDYKKANKEIFNNNTKNLNKNIYKNIKEQFKEGASKTKKSALKAGVIKKDDFKLGGSFFGLNDRKLNALIKSTKSDIKDVKYATLRMANDQYRQIIYKAQVFANTGAGTVKQAIDMASNDFLKRGFNCIEYKNGSRHNIADYCDMAIRTANKRANLMGEGEMRKKLGNSLVYISKHGGACDKCTPWEGRVYIDDVWSGGKENDGKYPLLSTAIAGGLFHPRCHHGASTYYEGINDEPEEVTQAKGHRNEEDKYTQYLQQRQKQYQRLAAGSLLPENVLNYQNNVNKLQNQIESSKIDTNKSETIKQLEKNKIEYNSVQMLNNNITEEEIIQKISGGDETRGSCSSLALTYIGNKNGLNVLDFRGGESLRFFSTPQNILKMCDELNIQYKMELNYNDNLGAMNLLNKVEEGNEYYLSTGAHATIVRKLNGKLQYLELQDKTDNGFKQFTSQTLKKRFGCKQTHTIQGMKCKARSILIDLDEFENKEDFKEILGYINTLEGKQLKGANGSAK
jgi:hypothetical protein|nr:MAG TPA: minor capsid protein [Caudoviricetes sp.]